ncbi:MAG TPA: hypothetical protein PLB81_04920 [Deltaproteobacteria bacterium]|nr:hypothetical protein [Deltaproteobacteria bacterium]
MAHDAAGDNGPDRTTATQAPRSSTPAGKSPDILASTYHGLARFNASLELFCRKLGHVLPDISREISNTSRKATLTMDSLISENPAGLIEITVSALDVSLARIDKLLRDQKSGDAPVLRAMESFRSALPAARDAVEDFHRRADGLGAALAGPSGPCRDSGHAHSLITRSRVMSDSMRELSDRLARWEEDTNAAARLHSDIVHSVEMHTALGVKSLKDTLGSVVMILKDLIARSNATARPVQAIMTALQIHDIVRQDIENILMVIARIRTPSEDIGQGEAAAFRQEACTISAGLLFEVSAVVREHVEAMARHIQGIHEIIASVRADKIHLAELLLINDLGSSTLDRALAEIAAMFQDLTERLDRLAALRKSRTKTLHEARELLDGLDQASLAALKAAEIMGAHAREREHYQLESLRISGLNLRAAVAALAALSVDPGPADVHARDAAEECITLILEDSSALRVSLLKIKDLLVDSIEGINDYANRCMLSVLRFKRRMERLDMFLLRLPDLAATLNAAAGFPAQAPQASEIRDAGLKAMLAALCHPHIKTLSRPDMHSNDSPPDDGDLTLF